MDREKGQEERCPSGAKMRQTFEWLSVLLISSTCFKNKQKKHIKRVVLVCVMQLTQLFLFIQLLSISLLEIETLLCSLYALFIE